MSRIAIVIPVLNEEAVLDRSVREVVRALKAMIEHGSVVHIVDNGSTDATPEIGRTLAAEFPEVRYLRIGMRGKGRAIRAGWEAEHADVYAFMDADLATDLSALPALLQAALTNDGIAYGSRFHEDSKVSRSVRRSAFSRAYRAAARAILGTRMSDVPCGFKAASRRVVRDIMPDVRDQEWFFDTELAVRAERRGIPLVEIPVTWSEHEVEGRTSKVNAPKLALQYLRKLFELRNDLS
jgi:glycosyltransferase involved in cell wall biosynthesis